MCALFQYFLFLFFALFFHFCSCSLLFCCCFLSCSARENVAERAVLRLDSWFIDTYISCAAGLLFSSFLSVSSELFPIIHAAAHQLQRAGWSCHSTVGIRATNNCETKRLPAFWTDKTKAHKGLNRTDIHFPSDTNIKWWHALYFVLSVLTGLEKHEVGWTGNQVETRQTIDGSRGSTQCYFWPIPHLKEGTKLW